MNTLERLDQWSASHNSKLLDVLRMALGIFLIIYTDKILVIEGEDWQ